MYLVCVFKIRAEISDSTYMLDGGTDRLSDVISVGDQCKRWLVKSNWVWEVGLDKNTCLQGPDVKP